MYGHVEDLLLADVFVPHPCRLWIRYLLESWLIAFLVGAEYTYHIVVLPCVFRLSPSDHVAPLGFDVWESPRPVNPGFVFWAEYLGFWLVALLRAPLPALLGGSL